MGARCELRSPVGWSVVGFGYSWLVLGVIARIIFAIRVCFVRETKFRLRTHSEASPSSLRRTAPVELPSGGWGLGCTACVLDARQGERSRCPAD